jgi:hypothetical protein
VAPSLLDENLAPVLQPTSGLFKVDTDGGSEYLLVLKVEIPSYYYNVRFSFNQEDVVALGFFEVEGARAGDQCPGLSFVAPEGVPTGVCNSKSCLLLFCYCFCL